MSALCVRILLPLMQLRITIPLTIPTVPITSNVLVTTAGHTSIPVMFGTGEQGCIRGHIHARALLAGRVC